MTTLVANAIGIFDVHWTRDAFGCRRFAAAGSGKDVVPRAKDAACGRARSAAAITKVGIEAGAAFGRNGALPAPLCAVRTT